MIEFEQEHLIRKCKMCGQVEDRWDNIWIEEKPFITKANNPELAVCCSCGFIRKSEEDKEEERNLVFGGVK